MDIGPIRKVGDRPVPVQVPRFEPSRRDAPAPAPSEPPVPEPAKEKEPA